MPSLFKEIFQLAFRRFVKDRGRFPTPAERDVLQDIAQKEARKQMENIDPVFKGVDKMDPDKPFRGFKPKVVPKEGMPFSYSSTIPFQKSMAEAELKVLVKAKMGSKELEITSPKIEDETTTTPLLIDLDDQVILTGDNFVRTNSFTKTAVINFANGIVLE